MDIQGGVELLRGELVETLLVVTAYLTTYFNVPLIGSLMEH
jgi:hypothetical protein